MIFELSFKFIAYIVFSERIAKKYVQMNHEANTILPTVNCLITAYYIINAYVWTDFLQVMTQSIHLG